MTNPDEALAAVLTAFEGATVVEPPVTLDIALAAWGAELNVVPVARDGSKQPGLAEWNPYRSKRVERQEVERWWRHGADGMGVICGLGSGGLVLFEFEGRAVSEGIADEFDKAARATGLGPVIDRIAAG